MKTTSTEKIRSWLACKFINVSLNCSNAIRLPHVTCVVPMNALFVSLRSKEGERHWN